MIKPSVLVTQPLHLDFPVFRWNMERFRDYFRDIYIGFSNHYIENQDLSNFIRDHLPFCRFVDVKRTRDDWRDDAVNCLLDAAPKDGHILFFEQDFLIKDSTFFDKVFRDDLDFLYYKEGERIHPAFAVVKRELIDKTSRNFAVCPPGDHFYCFFKELGEQIPHGVNIANLGVTNRLDYFHMNGLSQNYQNFKYDEPFYHPINFLYYNWKSLQFKKQHPLFYQIQLAIEKKYGHSRHTFLDNFFPLDERR